MKTVVNLTQEIVIGEIDSVLDTYPYQPYQQAFAIPDLRQELNSFVLNRIPCFYHGFSQERVAVAETEKDSVLNYKLPRNPLEQQLHIQNLIHQGISAIFKEKSDLISHHLCDLAQIHSEPSHWFG
ncbi:MAG TPA: hypothetical protein VK203_08610 [Nostocaceae cyanobacterium]|nr:hypothetical protein [Nostocaceae cyanobacterium]